MAPKKTHTDTIKYAFASVLQTYRREHNLTQEELGELVGVPREVVSCYETARRQIGMLTLLRWATTLNIEPSKLVPRLSSLHN